MDMILEWMTLLVVTWVYESFVNDHCGFYIYNFVALEIPPKFNIEFRIMYKFKRTNPIISMPGNSLRIWACNIKRWHTMLFCTILCYTDTWKDKNIEREHAQKLNKYNTIRHKSVPKKT